MTRLGARICAAAVVAVAAGLAAGARAQIASQSKAPVDITANEAEVVASKCMAVWRGAAEAIQDTTRLRADTITVYSKTKPGRAKAASAAGPDGSAQGAVQSDCGKPDRFVADGNVYYVTPDRNARSDHAVYDPDTDQIVMTGDVIVVQGENVARGDKLIINVADKQATMISNTKGAGKVGRVQGVYFPAQSQAQSSPGQSSQSQSSQSQSSQSQSSQSQSSPGAAPAAPH